MGVLTISSPDLEFVEDGILRLFANKNKPIGWYFIEQALRIPPEKFPPGTNVMTFLKRMNRNMLIEEKKDNQRRSGYVLTRQGKARVKSIIGK